MLSRNDGFALPNKSACQSWSCLAQAHCREPWLSSTCIITANATIKVKATNCSSRKVANPINAPTPLSVVTDSEAYLSTITVVLHEYFDSTVVWRGWPTFGPRVTPLGGAVAWCPPGIARTGRPIRRAFRTASRRLPVGMTCLGLPVG